MENGKQRIESVIFFKAFCVLGVLGVHSTSRAVSELPADSTTYELLHWANRLAKFGTPLFIFISAFLYFYVYGRNPEKTFDWRKFAMSRVNYVVIPFLIFSVIYYVLKRVVYPVDLTWTEQFSTFMVQLVTGKTYTHLYYILVALQFYLIFALVIEPLRKRKQLLKWMFPAAFGVHLLLLVANNQFQWIEAKGSLFLSYLSFFGLGAWFGTYFTEVMSWWRETLTRNRYMIRGLLAAFAVAGAVMYTLMLHKNNAHLFKENSLWIELSSLLYFIPMAVIIYALSDWFSGRTGKLSNGLRLIGEISFGIYLIHPMMLMLYRAIPLPGASPAVITSYVAGGYLFALAGSVAIIIGLRKMLGKLSNYSFGSVQKQETTPIGSVRSQQEDIQTKAS